MTRTPADRLAEIRTRFYLRYLARLRDEFTDRVARIHDANPLRVVDDSTNRVLRYLRGQPITGKHLIYAEGPNGPWRLGVVTHGAPGNLVLLDGSYADYRSAMRAIFHERRATFAAATDDLNGSKHE